MTGSHDYLTKIGNLLRLAERGHGPEAEQAMMVAQRMATARAIDLEVARRHVADKSRRITPIERTIQIGERGKRGLRTYVALFLAIAAANDVTCDIAGNSTRVFAFGFASDIDMCAALYASLVVQMVQASDAYLRSGAYRTETRSVPVPATRRHRGGASRGIIRYEVRPMHGMTARVNFQQAFAARIRRRLRHARHAIDAERAGTAVSVADDRTGEQVSTRTELVLADKQLELQHFYRAHSTARGSWRGYSAGAGHSSLSARAGDAAARAARLGADTQIGGQRQELGR